MSDTSRRAVLAGAAGLSATAVLTACGGTGGTGGSGPAAGAGDSAGGGSGGTLGTTAEIPVGGGKVFADQKVVVTQPKAGEFKAFSAICTHQGCTVGSVANGKINCPCHNSNFSATDGSVVNGPARSGLASRTITVDGDSITLG